MGRPRLWMRRGGSKASDRSVRPTRAESKAAGKSGPLHTGEVKIPTSRKGGEKWGTRRLGDGVRQVAWVLRFAQDDSASLGGAVWSLRRTS
jgi:hypothetical protein